MLGALLAVVHQRAGDAGVDRVLKRCGERRSAADLQRPDGWSTYEQGLALFHTAAETLGDPDVGRKAGMEVFRRYAGTEVLALLRSIGSPAEMIRVYPAISAKQSTITRSEVVEVAEAHGLISVVTPDHDRDPLFCGYTVGALSQFPVLFGMEPADVEELKCQDQGRPPLPDTGGVGPDVVRRGQLANVRSWCCGSRSPCSRSDSSRSSRWPGSSRPPETSHRCSRRSRGAQVSPCEPPATSWWRSCRAIPPPDPSRRLHRGRGRRGRP